MRALLLPTAHLLMPALASWALAAAFQSSLKYQVLASAGALVAYAVDRWRDPPAEAPPGLRVIAMLLTLLGGIGLLAVIGWVWLAPRLGLHSQANDTYGSLVVITVLAGLTVLHPLVARLPLAKELVVAMAWVLAAGADLPKGLIAGLAIAMATVACDYKDLEADRLAGRRSLPIVLGESRARYASAALALVAAGLASWLEPRLVAGCLCAIAGLLLPLRILRQAFLGALLVDGLLAIGFCIGAAWPAAAASAS